MVDEDLGGLALLLEQSGLGEEGEERPRLGEDLVELVGLGHDLGRVELEIDLAQVADAVQRVRWPSTYAHL